MLRFLHQLSAWIFYPLGLSFFVAYLGVRQEIASAFALWWLGVLDLPLLISGLLYGACSVILSVTDDHAKPSLSLTLGVLLPAGIILLAVLFLNFGFLSAS